jgi:hypothetical protein
MCASSLARGFGSFARNEAGDRSTWHSIPEFMKFTSPILREGHVRWAFAI